MHNTHPPSEQSKPTTTPWTINGLHKHLHIKDSSSSEELSIHLSTPGLAELPPSTTLRLQRVLNLVALALSSLHPSSIAPLPRMMFLMLERPSPASPQTRSSLILSTTETETPSELDDNEPTRVPSSAG